MTALHLTVKEQVLRLTPAAGPSLTLSAPRYARKLSTAGVQGPRGPDGPAGVGGEAILQDTVTASASTWSSARIDAEMDQRVGDETPDLVLIFNNAIV